ncbi:hypothetical protein [Lysinibacillus sp. SGAir0095]|uniref:hypothetical protein n=1 Tax=Lysinibacillus sp. SGAir0095 TaxID=2070463 RepID=UPI0010CCB2E7|nr:hypothetical protein [Lysinibacillus sp. SGAir0095]QCR33103.1 hypothetical protein C1N55_13345 [Lysinibacillus sp. SGAir0095]
MNFNNIEQIHKQIILDLTIRTLERDRKHIGNFKMQRAFEMWFDSKVNEMYNELKNIKVDLGKNGVKLQGSKLDGDFTVYSVIEKGVVSEKRYSNIALKNHCEVEVKRLLGLTN